MTEFDYSVLQEEFFKLLYQSKYPEINNREGAFDDAVLACKSILKRQSQTFGLQQMNTYEHNTLQSLFSKKLKPERRLSKNFQKTAAYNEGIRKCKFILFEHFERWGDWVILVLEIS